VRGGWARAGALAVSIALALGGATASAETPDERLSRAEREAAAAADEIATLDGQAAQVADELLRLRTRVADERALLRTVEGRLALAAGELGVRREVLAESEAEEDVARAALSAAEEELAEQDAVLTDRIATVWMLGGDPTPALVLELLSSAANPGDLAVGLAMLEAATGSQVEVVRDVVELRATSAGLSTAARTARRTAEDARSAADAAVAFARETRDQQAAVTTRLARAEAEQQALLAGLENDADRARVVLAAVETEVERAAAAVAAAVFGPVVPGETCPVVGARAGRDFTNDWGDPRSGGRAHEGTDLFADRGTPVVALAGGTVRALRRVDTGLGGLYVSVTTAGTDDHWYYAHLDTLTEGLQVGSRVGEGQQLGTVGNSGNALGTPPHLHIGFYAPGRAQNPYPTLASRC
jgi:murein DD-endopeptidase MepM/ murein hydrolase activator NlpD